MKKKEPNGVGLEGVNENPLLEEGGEEDADHVPMHEDDDEDDLEATPAFVYSEGITSAEAKRLLEVHGRNELPEKKIPKWYIFCQQLWQPMPCMIWLAAVVEAFISNYDDMGILLFIQFANASIGFYEITKAGDAVAALKKSLKPVATVKRDGKFINIDAALVVPGDCCLLGSGSAIPADCRVNGTEVDVDEAALTGESLPVTKYKGSSCKMGSTVVRGETEATVEFTGAETFFGKTASLLQNTAEFSNFQRLLISIILVLVVISTILCGTVFTYLIFVTSFEKDLSFTVVLMVASIPMAIEIVTTTTLALGSKELSREGAIVTRLAAIEDMAGMAILCSDKTGTLTLNKMVITDETPIYKDGETQYTILRYAAMAAKWKEPPRDALDTLVLNHVDLESMDTVEQIAYMPFDPVVKRTEGTVKEVATGNIWKATKGAPHVILKLVKESCESEEGDAIESRVEADVSAFGLRGIRCLAVAKTNQDGKWEFLGLLTFLDPPRPDTKKTIDDSSRNGVAVKMITGDHLLIAKETARVLGMGQRIETSGNLPMLDPVTKKKPANLREKYGDEILGNDGFAQAFPEHKYLIVECLREMGYKVGMTGDGVNDAPALKRADVGVAVEGATDAARAAADIVLTRPGLSTIVSGIIVARCIFMRIKNFLTYRIAATLQLVTFFFIAVLTFEPNSYMPSNWKTDADFPDDSSWPRFFAMPVLMLMLITLLNDGTLIVIGYDWVKPRETPEKWNLGVLYLISSVLAGVACISSLLLLWMLLDSWNSDGVFQTLGIGGLAYGQVTNSIYLKVSISDFLTLFSARTGEGYFWTTKPSPILLAGGCFALTASTVIACSWPDATFDDIQTMGLARRQPYYLAVLIWLYCIFWWLLQDLAKVGCYHLLRKYNILGYNDTGKLVLPQSTVDYLTRMKEKETNIV